MSKILYMMERGVDLSRIRAEMDREENMEGWTPKRSQPIKPVRKPGSGRPRGKMSKYHKCPRCGVRLVPSMTLEAHQKMDLNCQRMAN